MYFATIDCGTSTSRVYILDDQYRVVGKGQKSIGVRNTALTGSTHELRTGLKQLFEETAVKVGAAIKDIRFAVTSGMITSEIGLVEIPHLTAPAGIADLAENIKIVHDLDVFPLDIPVLFIRGIKNRLPPNATYTDLRKADFMRGEETQAAGLIYQYENLSYPIILMMLTSHTKFICINADKKISGCLTTLSGQIHQAVLEMTSIGKSIRISNENGSHPEDFNEEIIDTAFDSVQNAGFLRTLLMPRFMEILMDTNPYERRRFFEAIIPSEDLKTLKEFGLVGFDRESKIVIVGKKDRSDIYKYLLETKYGVTQEVEQIYREDEIDRLSISGAVTIAREAGIFKKNGLAVLH